MLRDGPKNAERDVLYILLWCVAVDRRLKPFGQTDRQTDRLTDWDFGGGLGRVLCGIDSERPIQYVRSLYRRQALRCPAEEGVS